MTVSKLPDQHQYNDQSIGSVDFLLAIMRDHTMPLAIRVDAAAKLLPIYQPPPQTLCIRITGGLPKELANIETKSSDYFDWRDRPEDQTSVH
jgi:hypothetical protein